METGHLTPSLQNQSRWELFVYNHPTSVKNLKVAGLATAIALTAITIFGAALLTYMHFSGLGICRAGFVQLGQNIAAISTTGWTKFVSFMKAYPGTFLKSHHGFSTLQIITEIILPTAIGTVLVIAASYKGPDAIKQLMKKYHDQRASQVDSDPENEEISSRIEEEEEIPSPSGDQQGEQNQNLDGIHSPENLTSNRSSSQVESESIEIPIIQSDENQPANLVRSVSDLNLQAKRLHRSSSEPNLRSLLQENTEPTVTTQPPSLVSTSQTDNSPESREVEDHLKEFYSDGLNREEIPSPSGDQQGEQNLNLDGVHPPENLTSNRSSSQVESESTEIPIIQSDENQPANLVRSVSDLNLQAKRLHRSSSEPNLRSLLQENTEPTVTTQPPSLVSTSQTDDSPDWWEVEDYLKEFYLDGLNREEIPSPSGDQQGEQNQNLDGVHSPENLTSNRSSSQVESESIEIPIIQRDENQPANLVRSASDLNLQAKRLHRSSSEPNLRSPLQENTEPTITTQPPSLVSTSQTDGSPDWWEVEDYLKEFYLDGLNREEIPSPSGDQQGEQNLNLDGVQPPENLTLNGNYSGINPYTKTLGLTPAVPQVPKNEVSNMVNPILREAVTAALSESNEKLD